MTVGQREDYGTSCKSDAATHCNFQSCTALKSLVIICKYLKILSGLFHTNILIFHYLML